MAQDVIINGTTYPAVETVALTDANGNTTLYYPDAVQYGAEQSLDDTQKQRARQNIGALASNAKVNGHYFVGSANPSLTLTYKDVGAPSVDVTLTIVGVDADGVEHIYTVYGMVDDDAPV